MITGTERVAPGGPPSRSRLRPALAGALLVAALAATGCGEKSEPSVHPPTTAPTTTTPPATTTAPAPTPTQAVPTQTAPSPKTP